MIRLITLDMAGTTIHDEGSVHKAFLDAMAAHDHPVSHDDANEAMGFKKTEAIRMMLDSVHGITDADDALVEAIHDTFMQKMIDFYRTDPSVRPIDGVEDLFRTLRDRGVHIALETGFYRPIADVIIDRLGWRDLIHTSTTSDEVEHARPAADLIRANMAKTGVQDVTEVLKAGDTPADLRSGEAAGTRFNVGVCTGGYTREQLAAEPHTHILDSLVEITDLID